MAEKGGVHGAGRGSVQVPPGTGVLEDGPVIVVALQSTSDKYVT